MPTLVLLRHASAAHSDDADHSRPLSRTGLAECVQIANALKVWLEHDPECVVSTAVRTQETFQEVLRSAAIDVAKMDEPLLYTATPGTFLMLVNQLHDDIAVMVGHNPAVSRIAALLADSVNVEQFALLNSFVPGSFAVLRSTLPWDQWSPGCADVLEVFSPSPVNSD